MIRILGVAVSLLLLTGASAQAQSPMTDAYDGSAAVLSSVAPTPPTGTAGAVGGQTAGNPGSEALASGSNGAPTGTAGAGGDLALDAPAVRTKDADAGTTRRVTVAAATSASASSLPFTGLDLGLLALGSVVLVGLGLALRRMGRETPTA